MKILVFLMTFLLQATLSSPNKLSMIKVRDLLHQAAESKKANKELKELLTKYEYNNPLINGYRGASVMIEGKHMFNPISRWNKFKQGKVMVENSIKVDENNYELRFLRFSIQTNIPPVLGYSANIQGDKKFLMERLENLNDADLRIRVINYMLVSKVCTREELNKLNQWKNR